MKKRVLLIISLLFVGLVGGAQSPCEIRCGKSKNVELGELTKIREELDNCRPLYLECTQGDNKRSVCQKEYFACKWGKTKELKAKGVEINNNFRTCVNDCSWGNGAVSPIVKNGSSPYCISLQNVQSSFIFYFGEAKFKEVSAANGCS